MKTVLLITSVISIGLSLGALWVGEIDRATFYLVWGFFWEYKNK